MRKEEWRPLPRQSEYSVSNLGRVIGPRGHRREVAILKVLLGTKDYHVVSIKGKGERVHRLVLEAFESPCPEGLQGAHLDGDKSNNTLSNLKWVTTKENYSHQQQHGTAAIGVKHGRAKLDEAAVRYIRKTYKRGLTDALAEKFGISTSTVQRVVYRKLWRHL